MSFQQVYGGQHRKPGIDPVAETFENEFLWGFWEAQYFSGLVIDGATRDVGNTGYTTILRAGLLLGMVTATRELTAWDTTATNGAQWIWGILKESRNMQTNSVDTDRFTGPIMVGGGVLANRLIIPGTTTFGIVGNALEFEVRKQLRSNFKLNDDYHMSRLEGFTDQIVSGATLTLLHSNSGTNFIKTGGALTIALPTPLKGVEFKFSSLSAASGSVITLTPSGGASVIVTPGVAAANTLVIDGEINIIRGTGTQWIVEALNT